MFDLVRILVCRIPEVTGMHVRFQWIGYRRWTVTVIQSVLEPDVDLLSPVFVLCIFVVGIAPVPILVHIITDYFVLCAYIYSLSW